MHGLRTIAFCKSRKLCELVAAYARENLTAAAPHKAHLVKVSGVWMEGGGLGGCVCVCVCFLGGGIRGSGANRELGRKAVCRAPGREGLMSVGAGGAGTAG